jgi:hypothetical protein
MQAAAWVALLLFPVVATHADTRYVALDGRGGGAYRATAFHCTMVDNIGTIGGVREGTAINGIVVSNAVVNHFSDTAFDFSCTRPEPSTGLGNITNDPQFASYATNRAYRVRVRMP